MAEGQKYEGILHIYYLDSSLKLKSLQLDYDNSKTVNFEFSLPDYSIILYVVFENINYLQRVFGFPRRGTTIIEDYIHTFQQTNFFTYLSLEDFRTPKSLINLQVVF